MYSLNYKAFPLLFTVYTTYPDALPHAEMGKGKESSLLHRSFEIFWFAQLLYQQKLLRALQIDTGKFTRT